jgi:hypothetical protein
MKKSHAGTAALIACAAAFALSACSPSAPEDETVPETNVTDLVDNESFDEPMANFVEPDSETEIPNFSITPESTPGAPGTSTAPAGDGLTSDDTMLDDAAATGMTTRVDRGKAPPPPAD